MKVTTKELQQQNEAIYIEVAELRAMVEELLSLVRPIPQDEGGYEDCIHWLREIPGAPKPNTKRSLNNYCGDNKLFKLGEAYKLIKNRRVFIRKGVEDAINKYIAG